MKNGRMVAVAAMGCLAASAAGAAILQIPLTSGDSGAFLAGTPSTAGAEAPAGPFEAIDPVSHIDENGVADAAVTTVEVSDSAVSSQTLDDALAGETDVVRLTGAPLPKPSLWAWMVAGFDGVGATIRRIAASA